MKIKILTIIIVIIIYLIGYNLGRGNQKPRYGKESGLPVNCRALIQDNLSGFSQGRYSAEEALFSIDRNCGPNGLIWGER